MVEIVNLAVKVDTESAIRDPLFLVDIFIGKLSFGYIDIGRWKKYVTFIETPVDR